jgi:hypothetical protein
LLDEPKTLRADFYPTTHTKKRDRNQSP